MGHERCCTHKSPSCTDVNRLPVVPARGWAEVALDLTVGPFSSIELACAVRLPGPCVRALCELVALLLSKNSSFTLHTALFTLRTSHSTLHLISNHLISSHLMSPHLSSSHFFPSFLTCKTVFISFEHWESSSQLISALLRARKLLLLEKIFCTKTLRAGCFCTQKPWDPDPSTQKILTKYVVLQSLHRALPSTTLYYKACTKYVPVRLCASKLEQSTSQYYFALQSLHKVLASNTLYNKACTKLIPV